MDSLIRTAQHQGVGVNHRQPGTRRRTPLVYLHPLELNRHRLDLRGQSRTLAGRRRVFFSGRVFSNRIPHSRVRVPNPRGERASEPASQTLVLISSTSRNERAK